LLERKFDIRDIILQCGFAGKGRNTLEHPLSGALLLFLDPEDYTAERLLAGALGLRDVLAGNAVYPVPIVAQEVDPRARRIDEHRLRLQPGV
jgi:hypothetical protein